MFSSPATDGRLRFRRDFQAAYEQGTALRGRLAVLICRPNDRQEIRWAVVASRKIGGAVQRNRCKRLLREAFRLMRAQVRIDGVDIVLVARPPCRQSGIREVLADLQRLYKEAGLLMAEDRHESQSASV